MSTYASPSPAGSAAGVRHGLEDSGEKVALGKGAFELDRVVDHDLGHGHDLIALRQLGELGRVDALRGDVGDAIAMCCARRTARGQCGQVGVLKTLMTTSSVSPPSAAVVSSLSPASPLETAMMESIRFENS